MFEDFKKAVLISYAEKKERKQLSENLKNPTQAKLRKECLSILGKRYLKKDDETIIVFFDPDNKFDSHELRIQKFELDGFKSLLQFFLKGHGIRKEENIKLLAWLIDFEPRPYVYGETYEVQEKAEETDILSKSEDPEPKRINKNSVKTLWKKIGFTTAIVLISLMLATYHYKSRNENNKEEIPQTTASNTGQKQLLRFIKAEEKKSSKNNSTPPNDKQCMYWSGDQYFAINCNKEIGDTVKFVLDTQKVAHFKKINEPDTLSHNSLGKVWYVKINGELEYFTSEGFHPIHTDRKLKRLSPYMLNKYILSKR